jgi:putative endonuclease
VKALGARGEDKAVRFLRKKGYRILERNYRSPAGEVDIIALDGETVVFVEVKTRADGLFGQPCEAVHRRKQEKLRKTALYYLSARRREAPARFDIIGIQVAPGGQRVEHIVDAFEGA